MITPPCGDDDTVGARRVFGEFVVLYHPLLLRVETQLDTVLDKVDPRFSDGYKPWQTALHELLKGAYFTAKNNVPPNPRRFNEALLMFSLHSASELLRDVCINSRLHISRQWAKQFQEHVNLLQISLTILDQGRKH